MSLLKTAYFVKSNIEENNNKYWRIELYSDNIVKTYFGRVGDTAQVKDFGRMGEKFFNKKIGEKTRKGYNQVDILSEKTVKQAGPNATLKDLIKSVETDSLDFLNFLVDVNVHNIVDNTSIKYNINTGAFSTPLGIIGQSSIDRAREELDKISIFITSQNYNHPELITLVENYLMLVPTIVGRKLSVQSLYPNIDAIEKQKGILDSLEASLTNVTTIQSSEPTARLFDFKLFESKDSSKNKEITDLFNKTKQKRHTCYKMQPTKFYEVELMSQRAKFSSYNTESNIMRLWHGSNVANILSILKNGLKIPRSYTNGWNFGPGIYLSDQSTKALNYATGYWSGKTEKRSFMFLADVAMGKIYEATSTFSQPPIGYDSSLCKPEKVKTLLNNEMIVYNADRVNLMYLVEFK